MLSLILYLTLQFFSVETSIYWITSLAQQKQYATILKQICLRESRCTVIGQHPIDSRYSPKVWTAMVRRNVLRPSTCVFHRDPYEWSTSGPYGLMRAYHWSFLGAPCVPPWVIDIPPIATWVALQKLKKHCASFCSYQGSRKYWKGKFNERNQ